MSHDGRRVSDLDRSSKKFFATFDQLERMWRQPPPLSFVAGKAREIIIE